MARSQLSCFESLENYTPKRIEQFKLFFYHFDEKTEAKRVQMMTEDLNNNNNDYNDNNKIPVYISILVWF